MWLRLVRNFTDNLDDNIGVGSLGVNIGDTDFAVLELEVLDALVDCLSESVMPPGSLYQCPYLLTHADRDLVSLVAKDKLRSLVVEELI